MTGGGSGATAGGTASIVLALFALWVLLAGAGRLLLQRRRTGDAGFRFAAAPTASVQWWANRIAGAGSVTVGVAAPLADLAGLPVLPPFEGSALRWGGTGVAALGVLATCGAQLAMGDSWRIGVDPTERTTLVTNGPFAVVRNPIFAAAVLTFLGLALAVPNVVAVVGLVAVVAGVELQVRRVEEPYLLATHGRFYARYAARVGRFLPGIGRLRRSTEAT